MSHSRGHCTLPFEFLDLFEFFCIGQIVYTIDKGSSGSDGSSDRAVSKEHELLNEMMCLVGMLEINLRRIAVFVQAESHFVLLDSEGTLCYTFGTKFLGKGVKSTDRFANRAQTGFA